MAHPDSMFHRKTFVEIRSFWCREKRRFPVFTMCGPLDTPTEVMCHELHAVADSENRNAKFENFRVTAICAFCVHTVRSTRENNPGRSQFTNLSSGHLVGMKLTIYAKVTYTTCDQLVVLASKVEHQNHLLFYLHKTSTFLPSSQKKSELLPRIH